MLVSIQGLVLVSEPYYNEAGYERQMGTLEGNHNSKQYNESTLLLVLKHMIHSLTHPTPPLSAFIHEHFRRRAPSILTRCQRILDSAVGTSADSAHDAGCAAAAGAERRCADSAGAKGGGKEEGGEEGAGLESSVDASVGWADRFVAKDMLPPLLRDVLVAEEGQ